MDSFRKWLNKPKADDKSLLARFYHADHSLTAVASELDSFDGRAEPERCSRLVGKLRTGQEQVLGITNLIMDELLGDERSSRAFRAKFPEEVLQDSLAGQLWFGAECLAAGSSILNREQESAEMRPLAKAVTKSLDNVRNLLREQCLRNNTPNSPRLNLNVNDAATEQLCESLKIFDKLFADFELRYVSAMVTVKTKQEHEMQELICVLFSETVHRALKLNLLDQDQVDSFDPGLMFSIPRLAIVAGLVIFKEGPLNMDVVDGQLSEMFRPFRTLLLKIRDLLRSLSREQLRQLERLLCTNEDVTSSTYSQGSGKGVLAVVGRSTKEASGEEQWPTAMSDNNNSNKREEATEEDEAEPEEKEQDQPQEARIFIHESSSSSDSDVDEGLDRINNLLESIHIPVESTRFSGHPRRTTAEGDEDLPPRPNETEDSGAEQIDVINDCASGYLVPNTNLGYLLQPSADAPLTDSFISTEEDDEEQQQKKKNRNNDEEDEEDDRNVHLMTTDDEEDEEERSRCLVDHFIDNVSTKSSTSSTDSSASSNTTSSVTSTTATTTTTGGGGGKGEGRTNHRSPSTSSVTSTTSSTSTTTTEEGDGEASDYKSTSTTPTKCLQEREREMEKRKVTAAAARDDSAKDSGMCTETNSSEDRSPESEQAGNATAGGGARGESETVQVTKDWMEEGQVVDGHRVLSRRYASNWENLQTREGGEATGGVEGEERRPSREVPSSSTSTSRRRRDGQQHRRRHHHHHSSSRSYLRRCVAYPSTSSGGGSASGRRISTEEVDMALGTSTTGLEDDHVAPEIADAIMDATKNHENLLHRLFVCIAGVADQLQTNFASDLRKILRSVFLMNVSPPEPVIDTNMRIQLGDGAKASSDSVDDQNEQDVQQQRGGEDLMFEFRPNESDVNETGSGSNQSINSAEEVNPEMGGDNVFDDDSAVVPSPGGSPATPIKAKQQRCASEEQSPRPQRPQTDPGGLTERQRNINNSSNTNNNNNSSSSSSSTGSGGGSNAGGVGGGTVTRSHSLGDTSTMVQDVSRSHLIRSRLRTTSSSVDTRQSAGQQGSRNMIQRPPRWVPDEEAPRCMSCASVFTAFRRRHHCRHCGRVFCGICSNVSVPIPKYGFVKAVRICQGCYRNERELGTTTFS